MIDREVYHILTQNDRHWGCNKGGYSNSGPDLMHRLVMKIRHGEDSIKNRIVDHIDGDRLNNTYANLRIVDSKANAKNRTTKTEDQPFEGVHLITTPSGRKTFCCKIKKLMVYMNDDPKMCALCHDSVVTYVYGEGKRLNDNRSQNPISIAYWNFSPEIMEQLDKMKASHTDLRGVTKSGPHWKSKITINLGYFETQEEAARMYDLACLAFGTESTLNYDERYYTAKDISNFMRVFYGKLL